VTELKTSELGEGAAVVVMGDGFANTEAHRLLATRFRVVAIDAAAAPEAVAAWVAGQGLEGVGFLGLGTSATVALKAAEASAERAKCVVLVSPQPLPASPDPIAPGLRLPKAVLIGSRDASQPRDAISVWRRALPGSNVVLVFDAGADVVADRHQAFADAAGDFLDRQGRFAFMTESVARLPA
jgi:pimeloyl-ACP methyl ester carboxylesterase